MPKPSQSGVSSAALGAAVAADPESLVVVNLATLKAALREVLAEVPSGPPVPEFYSQTCLPPGMTRRAFLDAIRRGDFPARAVGKVRLVARADFLAFVSTTPPVRVRFQQHPTPANDVRALVRASQGR